MGYAAAPTTIDRRILISSLPQDRLLINAIASNDPCLAIFTQSVEDVSGNLRAAFNLNEENIANIMQEIGVELAKRYSRIRRQGLSAEERIFLRRFIEQNKVNHINLQFNGAPLSNGTLSQVTAQVRIGPAYNTFGWQNYFSRERCVAVESDAILYSRAALVQSILFDQELRPFIASMDQEQSQLERRARQPQLRQADQIPVPDSRQHPGR